MNMDLHAPWGGDNIAAATIRLLVIFVGFTLALTCVRFAVIARRRGQGYRVPGILAVACLVITPSLTALYRLNEDVLVLPAITYIAGLVLALVALRRNYTVTPAAWRLGGKKHRDDESDRQAV